MHIYVNRDLSTFMHIYINRNLGHVHVYSKYGQDIDKQREGKKNQVRTPQPETASYKTQTSQRHNPCKQALVQKALLFPCSYKKTHSTSMLLNSISSRLIAKISCEFKVTNQDTITYFNHKNKIKLNSCKVY